MIGALSGWPAIHFAVQPVAAVRLLEDGGRLAVDACTLNNALNVVQLAVLLAILKWVRRDPPGAANVSGGGMTRGGRDPTPSPPG